MSGTPDDGADFNGVMAGVGSLGSVLADMWNRGGWGKWTFIDPDQVAPHNLVRHGACALHVGWPKAHWMKQQSSYALGLGRIEASAICASASDFSHAEVARALESASLLVDVTTTIDVPRDWSERELPRSASAFFTFSGLSAVLMLEDKKREIRLSALEGQYYRAVINESWGNEHLKRPGRVRVGAGCRDHSFVLSYELVQMHAAQLARRLRKAAALPGSVLQVWTLDDETGSVSTDLIEVHHTRSEESFDWAVRWDAGLEAKMRAMREGKLPSETGGILVGVIDQKLRTITMVDASEAPIDSKSDEHSFVRGAEGGQAFVSKCMLLTGEMVGYVGEWHSHPRGHSAKPSSTDIALLATLTMRMREDGIPALMVIVSDEDFGVSLATSI